MKKKHFRRGLSLLLALLMVSAVAVPTALAEDDTEDLYVEITAHTDDRLGLYVIEEGEETSAGVWAELKNTSLSAVNGTVEMVTYRRDLSQPMEPVATKEISIPAEETLKVYLNTPVLPDFDYYWCEITVKKGTEVVGRKQTGFSLIHKAHEGIIEDSVFGANIFDGGSDPTALQEISERLGMKWRRGIPNLQQDWIKPTPDSPTWDQEGGPTENLARARASIEEWESYGVKTLGYINYNNTWNVEPIPGRSNYGAHENRPHDLDIQAEVVYHTIKGLADKCQYWELWNEPWIFGWTWATGTPQDYRDMVNKIYDKIHSDPSLDQYDLKTIGGGSTAFDRDCMYPYDASINDWTQVKIDGSANHAYGSPNQAMAFFVNTQALLDKKASISDGSGGMWQTEFGTMASQFPEIEGLENQEIECARACAPLHLEYIKGATDAGTEMHTFWFALGYDGDFSGDDLSMYYKDRKMPKPVTAAYNALTYCLEYKTLKRDLYETNRNIYGFVFEDKRDQTATAALFTEKPYGGHIKMDNLEGIKVYDFMGGVISDGSKSSIDITTNHWETVYFVSDKSVDELSEIILNGSFVTEQPLAVYPKMFTKPLEATGSVDLEIENVAADVLNGTIKIKTLPEGFTVKADTIEVSNLMPSEQRTVSFPLATYKENKNNRYFFEFTVTLDNGLTYDVIQPLQVAFAPKKTVTVDGDLSDWEDVTSVSMLTNSAVNYQELLWDPSSSGIASGDNTSSAVVAYKVKTAWDDDNFYFAAEVPDGSPSFNPPFLENDHLFGFQSDSIQIGFDISGMPVDFGDYQKVEGYAGYEKYYANDTDYEYVLRRTISGAGEANSEMERLLAPGTNIQGYYPTNPSTEPPLGPLDAYEAGGSEGKIKVNYDATRGMLVYEAALPWKLVDGLGNKLTGLGDNMSIEEHFAFVVNDMGTGSRGTSFWTREAGKVITGGTGFAPRWSGASPSNGGRILTPWGYGTISNPISILVNGKLISADTAPMIQNDRTLVPMRTIFEALGADVQWDQATRTVTGTKDGQEVVLQIDNGVAKVNGQDVALDAAPTIINDRTVVPLRFVGEALGANVDWNADARQVIVKQ